jgi:hypothetical protein
LVSDARRGDGPEGSVISGGVLDASMCTGFVPARLAAGVAAHIDVLVSDARPGDGPERSGIGGGVLDASMCTGFVPARLAAGVAAHIDVLVSDARPGDGPERSEASWTPPCAQALNRPG